jgi:diphosphomevalonate decarboxylase
MPTLSATAISSPNIALIKYWGNQDDKLRLPANASLSMNLDGLETRTTVSFDPALTEDEVILENTPQSGPPKQRVVTQLNHIRQLANMGQFARVESHNNFPAGAGIASSASAFAALSVAGAAAAGLALTEAELSALARLGSGSAARSVPAGFVEWHPGARHADSFAVSIAPPEHWAVRDVVAVVSQKHKAVGSSGGHPLAATSPLQGARVASVPGRFEKCKAALLARDFGTLAEVVEADSNIMHAVMMTSQPPLIYWEPITLAIMKAVRQWRLEGLTVCYTIDAGANVHCLCPAEVAPEVERRLRANLDVNKIFTAGPGGPTRLVTL